MISGRDNSFGLANPGISRKNLNYALPWNRNTSGAQGVLAGLRFSGRDLPESFKRKKKRRIVGKDIVRSHRELNSPFARSQKIDLKKE